MIRALFFCFALAAIGFSTTGDIDKKIASTSKQLKSFDKEYSSLHAKVAATAKAILEQKGIILKQQKKLKRLTDELTAKEESYQLNKKEIDQLAQTQQALSRKQAKVEQELVFAIARNVSLSMLLEDDRAVNADAMITEEVLKQLTEKTRNDIKELNAIFAQNAERIEELNSRSANLKNAIDEIDAKRQELQQTHKRNKQSLAHLEADEVKYKTSVRTLLNQQNALKKNLSHLNIIKRETIQRQKEEEERKRQEAELQRRTAMQDDDLPDIKLVGSSYQKLKTKRYRGQKTIAPLDSYKVVKKFGPYTDPIYKIKIFNESVSLQPKQSGSKVKNVLNGKVIFAKETPVLNNVIVVEHSNGIHTIYSNLDKIAPTIKTGKKIKKGYVIGRVKDELIFGVTQKNYHIDPLQLIN